MGWSWFEFFRNHIFFLFLKFLDLLCDLIFLLLFSDTKKFDLSSVWKTTLQTLINVKIYPSLAAADNDYPLFVKKFIFSLLFWHHRICSLKKPVLSKNYLDVLSWKSWDIEQNLIELIKLNFLLFFSIGSLYPKWELGLTQI